MGTILRVLVLEDNQEDAELMVHELRQSGYEPIWQVVEDEEEYLSSLTADLDVILADYSLPQFDALRALRLLQERGFDIPFIVVTATLGDEMAVDCMREGAADYLLKDRMARLGRAVAHAVNARRIKEEKRQAEEALRESEEKYRLLVEGMHDAVFAKNTEGRYTLANNQLLLRMQRLEQDIIGKLDMELFPLDVARRIVEDDRQVLDKGVVVDAVYEFCWQGRKLIVDVRKMPIRDEAGAITGLVAVSRDVTERKRAQEELEDSERRFRSVAETARDAIIVISGAGDIVFWNKGAEATFGYSSEEMLGKHFGLIVPEDYREFQRQAVSRLASKPVPNTSSVPLLGFGLTKAHRRFPLEATYAAWQAKGESFFTAIVRDITERKLAEDELKESYHKLERVLEGTTKAITLVVEMRDPYTAGHQQRVANLGRAIARELGLEPDQTEAIRLAAIVHDIGKISIPAEILSKPGRLTFSEFEMIKTHPRVGFDILSPIEFPWPIAQIVHQHHERLNGSGYPSGLSGDQILLEARILGVADVVEAMSSHRPYRPSLGIDKALEEIEQNKGILYDPRVADACLRLFSDKKFDLQLG